MAIKMNIVSTATIDMETVKELLIKSIEKETGNEVKDLRFVMGVRSTGYGRDECDETYLEHVHVTFDTDKSPPSAIKAAKSIRRGE